MLKFNEGRKKPEITSKKTWLSLKEISYLQVIFVLIWMKKTLIWFNLQRDGNINGLSNIKDPFAESLQLQMSVLHQIGASSRRVSQAHMMAGQNIKRKYLICQIPIKMLKQHAIANSNSSNGFRKTSKIWTLCMWLTQQFYISEFSAEDITSDHGFLLWLLNTFTFDTDEYYPKCYRVNNVKTFKNLAYYFKLCAHKSSYVYCRLARLNWTFIDFVLGIIASN